MTYYSMRVKKALALVLTVAMLLSFNIVVAVADPTEITVKAGEQIGCSNIVSGGSYYIDNGSNFNIDGVTVGNPPSWIAIINEGFSAEYAGDTYDGDGNNAVVTFINEGNNSLITIDKTTNKRYLHVINLVFADRPVQVDLSYVYDDVGPNNNLTYFGAQYIYRFNQENDIQEAGVVFAKDMLAGSNSFELEIGKNGVHSRVSAPQVISEGFGSFTTENVELSSTGTYYVRGYVKADGKYFYSDTISSFVVTALGSDLVTGPGITIDYNGKTQEAVNFVAPDCTARIGSHTYTGPQSITLDEEGTYYILYTWSDGSNSISYVVIDRTPPEVTNVTDGAVYNSVVMPSCTENNVSFYLSKDSGPENEFASDIKITENGGYALKAIDSVGNVRQYYFEIKTPVVTTLDVFSVTTHTAEVSANFQNNGTVLERGFVYSNINNTPIIGDIGCTTFVPQVDQNPGFLTVTLTGLAINSPYYFRAYLKTGEVENPKITYGEIKGFTTANLSVPSVTIINPSDITTSTMTISANVYYDGGAEVTRRGIVYSTSQNPTDGGVNCTTIEALTGGTGNYALTMKELTRDTSYYIRAFATNNVGTGDSGYDFVLHTQSTSVPPTIALTSVDTVTKNTAAISCNITDNGRGAITEQGVLYSTSPNPTMEDEENGYATKVVAPSNAGYIYTTQLTALSRGTKYYVKGYAINEAGTSLSDQQEFTTVADLTGVMLEMSPTTPTNGNVVVTITYPDPEFVVQKKYKIDSGELKDYTGPITVTENCSVFALYTNQNGAWQAPTELKITNIDRIAPTQPIVTFTRPTLEYSGLRVQIKPGSDSGNGVDKQSGVDYVEYKIGADGTWERYTEPPSEAQALSVSENTWVYARTVDKAGNASPADVEREEIRGVAFTTRDQESTVNHAIHITESVGYENATVKNITLKGSIQSGEFEHYVNYNYGDGYKGCGVKAAQIFSDWFGFDLTQSQVKDYVETTDFSLFIDIASFGVTWLFDLVDPSIFTTPAQLDSGLQNILDEKYTNYNVVRHSPGTKAAAIAMIESYLSHGYPVIMLVDDGEHWQVITESNVKRDQDGTISDANFLVHDNAGSKSRTWSQLDYYFEDNFSAEAARLADYTSYKDTIMSIEYESAYYRDNWSSGWTTSKVFSVQDAQGVSAQYLFLLKKDTGLVHINKVNNGAIGQLVATYNWSSGWDNASFYTDNGITYLVLAKSSNAVLNIRKMNADGTVGDLKENSNVPGTNSTTQRFVDAKTVIINNKNYLLVRKQDSYNNLYANVLYSLEQGGRSGNKVSSINSPASSNANILWDTSVVYQAGGHDYLLVSSSQTGKVSIYAIDENAQIIHPKVADYDWSAGWTKFQPFTIFGKTYLLIAKSGIEGSIFGTADVDGITRIHRVNEDGTIGEMVDDAYWDTVSNIIGTYGYDKTEIYQTSNGGFTFLLALRSYDGNVKTLRLIGNDREARIQSNLNY